ncbi:MAG: ATP-binding protein [Candidatus Cloacimonetes bacterium]|nr:ATP-binding protein [Candidatus Cloacimonadota bacterium]
MAKGLLSVRDIISPSGLEVDFNHIQVGGTFYRIFFIAGYPREVGANWLSPLINFSHPLDLSMFYYPMDAREVLGNLRRKITEMETELNIEYKEGRILDPEVQLALQDAKALQDELVAEREKFFQFALYVALPAEDLKTLSLLGKQVESVAGGVMLLPRKTTLQMEEGFKSMLPYFDDKLMVYRNMDTTSIATTFPFTSSSLSSDRGVMYGINEHNGSLIIFDRFSLENANMVVFAKAGGGKSYAIKLEAVRSLMLGTEIIIIDPENEYQTLCEAIGGEYIRFDFNSPNKLNPFDLSQVYEEGMDELGMKILTLHSLLKVMMRELSAGEEAILDRALIESFRMKGITRDPDTQKLEPPLLEDLYKVLLGMEEPEAKSLADRIERYVKGSAKGLFDAQTNVDIKNTFTVFGIRDLEESVRPIGMFLILDYIWTRIRRDKKKRILIVDEAWFMMQHPDSANFLFSIAKRARKYYLGLTTITQDVEDFLATDKGKAIVTNSSIQLLMKQSPAAIDKLVEVFYLSEGERNLLLSCNVGEGIFFAGEAHVAMQVIASMKEHQLITTNPAELEAMRRAREEAAAVQSVGVAEEPFVEEPPSEPTESAPPLADDGPPEPPIPPPEPPEAAR